MCTLTKKRTKKALQNESLVKLIELKNERQDHYLKATQCCQAGDIVDGKIVFRYCRSRICRICNNIKTATLINKYESSFDWENSHLLTLTCQNSIGQELSNTISEMKKCWYLVRQKMRRDGIDLNGIYTTEVTYNKELNTYHPHFHIITTGLTGSNCEKVVKAWLETLERKNIYAVSHAQDWRKVKDSSAMLELFKYVTKDFKETSAEVLDTIIKSVWGKRMVQTFGNIKAQDETQQEVATYTIDAVEGDRFLWAGDDWYSAMTGESLIQLYRLKKPPIARISDANLHAPVPNLTG
jgi:plasmid rolling circle replication initiator protein Rep